MLGDLREPFAAELLFELADFTEPPRFRETEGPLDNPLPVQLPLLRLMAITDARDPERAISSNVETEMEGCPVPKAPVIGQSVAAMMRRSPSLAESHLILASSGAGFERRWGDEAGRR
jgi:hypothetical protein